MKTFSQGHSSTPMLHEVRLQRRGYQGQKTPMLHKIQLQTPMLQKVRLERRGYWEGSLNSTIQQLFRKNHAMIEECEISKEDQNKPSTSNTKALQVSKQSHRGGFLSVSV